MTDSYSNSNPVDVSFEASHEEVSAPVGTEPDAVDDYLKGVAEQDRPIVKKYMDGWNKSVTQRLQKNAEKYKAYTELGPVEQLQQAHNWFNGFRSNPAEAYRIMRQNMLNQFGDEFTEYEKQLIGEAIQQMSDDQEYAEVDEGVEPSYDEMPEHYQRYLDNMRSEIEELKSYREQQEQAQIEAQEDEQLDQVLAAMHNKYGQFNDQWIFMGLSQGMSPEQAYQSWQNHVQEILNSQQQRPQAPRLLGGQGGIPNDRVEMPKNPADRRKLVADLLANSQQ